MVNNYLVATLIAIGILTFTGCANSTANIRSIDSVPGVNATGIRMIINEDKSVILRGEVKSGVEKVLIEKYVQREYGYENISNQISINN